VRLLVVAWGIGYAVDMVCSFLYGINGAHHALVVNAVGTLVAVILAVPMTQAYGLIGACLALIVSNVVRLAASHAVQRRSLAHAGTT
jgi:O-antigen/teichoic acid export membrane protein